jgi:hypothetical protein
MLVTGFVILEQDPILTELRQKAKSLLAQPPEAPQDLTFQRYLTACLYEDAEDVVEKDPETAEMILNRAVMEMVTFCFIQAGKFIPRQKSLLDELAELDVNLAELARSYYQTASPEKKMEIAGMLADRTIGARGFFEWETPPNIFSE